MRPRQTGGAVSIWCPGAQIRPNSQSREAAALLAQRGIAMERFARAFISVLLLAAATLSAGCSGVSDGRFSPDQFWEKQSREGN